MTAIGRVFLILMAMGMAAAASLLLLPILILFDPLQGDVSLVSSIGGFIDLLQDAFNDVSPSEAMTLLAGFLWTAAVMICVVPVVIVATIGELAGLRSPVWYCGGSGALSAAMPWLLRILYHLEDAGSAKPIELRFALLFFLAGTAAGLVYWLIRGRRAGREPKLFASSRS